MSRLFVPTLAVLAMLSLAPAAGARFRTREDPREKIVERQRRENEQWKKEAEALEKKLASTGDEYYKHKQFDLAAEYYTRALSIRYYQWDLREVEVGGFRGVEPARNRILLPLDTSTTRRLRARLRSMADAVKKFQEDQAKKQLNELMEKAEVAAMLNDPFKTYLAYGQVVTFAAGLGDKKFAVQAALKAQAKQKEILTRAAKPLDEAEKLLQQNKPAEAMQKIEEFRLAYGNLTSVVPELDARLQMLLASPALVAESREREINQKILLGDAALLRKDYLSAYRHYREAATTYPEAEAAKRAAEKMAGLMDDPDIAAAIRRQQAEAECKPLLARAERCIQTGDLDQAREVCRQVIRDHPDTEWAARAAEILDSLDPGEGDPQ